MLNTHDTQPSSGRYKTASVHFTNDDFVCVGLLNAFNQQHPNALVLDVIWNGKPVARYRCTKKTCTIGDIERLIGDAALSPEKANADFKGTSVEEGTKLLWSNLHLAGVNPSELPYFGAVENGCLHFPLRSAIAIYTDPQVRVTYLDWVIAVTKSFDRLLGHSRLSA